MLFAKVLGFPNPRKLCRRQICPEPSEEVLQKVLVGYGATPHIYTIMRKLILMGRVAAGKTTLTQALRGEQIHYCKTQYINYHNTIIDTPGEYTEVARLAAALALYAYEADVVGLVVGADEPFACFRPAVPALSTAPSSALSQVLIARAPTWSRPSAG